MKILVVDDEKIILQGIVRLLKSNPLVDDVYWAEDAFIALDFLKGHQVDAVVTDIRMPEMDGLELIRIAREEELATILLSYPILQNLSMHSRHFLSGDGIYFKTG